MQIETLVDLYNAGFVRHVAFYAFITFGLIYLLIKKGVGLKESAWAALIVINLGGIIYELMQYKEDIIIDVISNNVGYACGLVLHLARKTAQRDKSS